MYIINLLLISLVTFNFIAINIDIKIKQYMIKFIFIFLAIISGIRYYVGVDYGSYEIMFRNNTFNKFPEFAYWLLSYIAKQTYDEFYIITIAMSFITVYFIYKGLRVRDIEINYTLLSILIFMCNLWPISFNIMRQCASVAIFFYASIYIKEKKLLKYIIYILIATAFHKSSILLLPLYFISYIDLNLKTYTILVILAYVFVEINLSQKILSFIAMKIPQYRPYAMSAHILSENQNGLSLGVLANVLISFIVLIISKKKINKKYYLEKNYYLYGTIINILSISTYMYDRIGIYFKVFEIFTIPYVISKIENKHYRSLILSLIITLMIGIYLKTTLLADSSSLMKYNTIFNK